MKTRVKIYYRYGAWRVQITNVGAMYDIRRIHNDMLRASLYATYMNATDPDEKRMALATYKFRYFYQD